MTAVGDKQILTTQTLLLGDDEVGKFDVQVEEGTQFSVAVRFPPSQDAEATLGWRFEDGTLNIEATGWSSPGGGAAIAKRIGDYSGRPLGFKFASQRLGTLNLVTLQFYLGGGA